MLQPVRAGGETKKLDDYNLNGIVIQPGIKVGEYEKMVMESIYGKGVAQDT